MSVNLFPAILLAGPPHCGKSVLSFLLSHRLRERKTPHYLLRAVPDGEGDWFLEGEAALMRAIRLDHKTGYSERFVQHFCAVIANRLMPLLVDIGGRPQGDQFEILRACTHAILLYRTEEERRAWQDMLTQAHLLPLAELRSSLEESEGVTQRDPALQGVIAGLERDPAKRRSGPLFAALLERVAGVCAYPLDELEAHHLSRAPLPPLTERQLARQLGLPDAETNPHWEPEHLKALNRPEFPTAPVGLYGRGPIWLAAMLLARAPEAPAAIFDVRYGWVKLPEALPIGDSPAIEFSLRRLDNGAAWIAARLPDSILEIEELKLPRVLAAAVSPGEGVILSGRLPRWAFAALGRAFAPRCLWVGVDEPKCERIVIVHSQSPEVETGDVLPRPLFD